MRWDRLFDDLEAQAAELERDERDALVDELRDGDWAETSWRQLLGGRVALEVQGAGRIEGEVALVNERIVQICGERDDHIVAVTAVLAVHATERRADEAGKVGSALGWGHALRALREAGQQVTIRLVDGTARQGTIHAVGQDFVRILTESGRASDVPWAAMTVVSGRS